MLCKKVNTLELYKIFADEELKFIEMHQNRVKFFAGLLSGLVAGTVAGLFKSDQWYEFALMGFGPVLIIMACSIAQRSTFRLYQRFLEAVTVRAKLEQIIGLTERPKELDDIANAYWSEEPIIATRHLNERRDIKIPSKEWVDAHIDKGYHGWITKLFRGGQVLGVVMMVAIAILTWNKFIIDTFKFIKCMN